MFKSLLELKSTVFILLDVFYYTPNIRGYIYIYLLFEVGVHIRKDIQGV